MNLGLYYELVMKKLSMNNGSLNIQNSEFLHIYTVRIQVWLFKNQFSLDSSLKKTNAFLASKKERFHNKRSLELVFEIWSELI